MRKTMFIVRKSEHINEDIKRNWSSWNYGLEGIKATEEQIELWKNQAIENEIPFCISGFELWGDEILNSEIKELFEGYWVLVDNFHGTGLSCNVLNVNNIDEAIELVTNKNFEIELGEGEMRSCENAVVVYSKNDIHILEIKD